MKIRNLRRTKMRKMAQWMAAHPIQYFVSHGDPSHYINARTQDELTKKMEEDTRKILGRLDNVLLVRQNRR